MVAALSPSSISTWKQCPKRFFFEKILRLETEPGVEAVCGSFVHDVLEHLMGLAPAERTAEAARRIATERWAEFIVGEEHRFAELGLDEQAVKDFKRRAWTGITGYFAIEDPTRIDVVATEQEMQADLDGAPLFGIVDRLERWGERLVVSDYKTGKAPKWQDEIDEKLEQLRLYAAILDAQGTPVSTLRLLFLSPQLGAAAKQARCAEAAEVALTALTLALPLSDAGAIASAVDQVEQAHRQAREGAAATDDRNALARVAACDAAWLLALELCGLDAETAAAGDLAGDVAGDAAAERPTAVAQLLLDVVAARRKAFFALRDAQQSRPGEIVIDVLPEHIQAARLHVAAVWQEANACYDAWDFPARPGVLCDWCPFSSQCDGFAAWDAAGRPAPTLPS